MVEYIGIRRIDKCEVYRTESRNSKVIRRTPLPVRSDICDYGGQFDWGSSHHCDSALQLSIAILADHTRDVDKVLSLHQSYKNVIIVGLHPDFWRLSAPEIDIALRSLQSV